jgi:adenylate kinase family enzyme
MSTAPDPRFDRAVVIVGARASGKSTIGRLLAVELSYPLYSFGAYVRSEAARRELRVDKRELLEKLGSDIITQRGYDQFLQDVLESQVDKRSVILEGVRHAEMLQAVRRTYRLVMSIYLDVSPDLRYRRWLNREVRADTPQARAVFDAIANAEVESNVHALITQVEHVVEGDRDPQLIFADILTLLAASSSWQ